MFEIRYVFGYIVPSVVAEELTMSSERTKIEKGSAEPGTIVVIFKIKKKKKKTSD